MKILIVSTVEFHLNGITSVIMNYFRHIQKDKIQLDFLVMNYISEDLKCEIEGEGGRVFCLPRKKNPLAYMSGLCRILKRERYDIIHVHGNSATMAIELFCAWLCRVTVRIAHSHSTSCEHKKLHRLLYPLFQRCCTHALACGDAAGRWLFGGQQYTVMKNGVDLPSFFYDEEVRKKYRLQLQVSDEEVLIGHIGNFVPLKNHSFLIDVFSIIKNQYDKVKLLLISDGPLMEEMKEKVRQLKLDDSVIFLGRTTEAAAYYQTMDLFVLPSVYEGVPVVLIEAQAAGLPCIVSDKVSPEVDVTGFLEFLSIDSACVWSDRIRNLIAKTQDDRAQRCAECQKAITDTGYNIMTNADRLYQLYQMAINNNKQR